jgi:hypothetical protein
MVFVSRLASDIELLAIVRDWLDALAREDYESVFAALGYAVANGRPGAECIREEIKRYRSPEYFPGIDEFAVTDWRAAQGGNPEPLQLIRWYEPNELGIRATVEIDLPMNGRWSDLEADFLLLEKGFEDGYLLRLEHIGFPTR